MSYRPGIRPRKKEWERYELHREAGYVKRFTFLNVKCSEDHHDGEGSTSTGPCLAIARKCKKMERASYDPNSIRQPSLIQPKTQMKRLNDGKNKQKGKTDPVMLHMTAQPPLLALRLRPPPTPAPPPLTPPSSSSACII